MKAEAPTKSLLSSRCNIQITQKHILGEKAVKSYSNKNTKIYSSDNWA